MSKVTKLAGGTLGGATIAVWGLTYKAHTDDLRFSPALQIAHRLATLGAKVQAYDPAIRNPI